MKVRIIKNSPLFEDMYDISHLIGKTFDVIDCESDSVVIDCNGEYLSIFHDEYEIVDDAP